MCKMLLDEEKGNFAFVHNIACLSDGHSSATRKCRPAQDVLKPIRRALPSTGRTRQKFHEGTSMCLTAVVTVTLTRSSVVRYLEDRLAEIENNPSRRRQDSPSYSRSVPAYSAHAASGRTENVYYSVLRVANTAVGSICTSSLLQNSPGIHYEGKLFYASERPPLKIPIRGIYNEEPPRMASQGSAFRLPDMGALRIPFKVAKALFDNYISNILPRYPCFAETDLSDQFEQFYPNRNNAEQVSSDTTWFIISMILAISSLTSKAHDFQKVAKLSESLQRDALRRSSFLGETNIRSLQCFLLLIQMALLLPYTCNQWYMSGEAMRMAIALGLNQEAEGYVKLDSVQMNLRRRIFWTVCARMSRRLDHGY